MHQITISKHKYYSKKIEKIKGAWEKRYYTRIFLFQFILTLRRKYIKIKNLALWLPSFSSQLRNQLLKNKMNGILCFIFGVAHSRENWIQVFPHFKMTQFTKIQNHEMDALMARMATTPTTLEMGTHSRHQTSIWRCKWINSNISPWPTAQP